MALVRRQSVINLSDYFCRGGFGDGDDRIAMDAGYDYADDACEILNGIMEAKGLTGWTAESETVSSIHNTLFIEIKKDGKELPISSEWTETPQPDFLEGPNEEDDLYKEFCIFRDKVWKHAFNEFEKLLEEREKNRKDW
jgi:hypothetical protein